MPTVCLADTVTWDANQMAKVVLEFGIRGGYHIDNAVIPSAQLAGKLAAGLINTFSGDDSQISSADWVVSRKMPRKSWTSNTHFVSVTRLDGVARGSASASLWKV